MTYNCGPTYTRLFDAETPSKFDFSGYENHAQYASKATATDLVRYLPATSSPLSSASATAAAGCYPALFASRPSYAECRRPEERDSRSTTLRSSLYRSGAGQHGASLPLYHALRGAPSYLGLTSPGSSSMSSSTTFHGTAASRRPQLADWTSSPTSPAYHRPRSISTAAVDVRSSTSSIDYWRPTTFGDGAVTSTDPSPTTTPGNRLLPTLPQTQSPFVSFALDLL